MIITFKCSRTLLIFQTPRETSSIITIVTGVRILWFPKVTKLIIATCFAATLLALLTFTGTRDKKIGHNLGVVAVLDINVEHKCGMTMAARI